MILVFDGLGSSKEYLAYLFSEPSLTLLTRRIRENGSLEGGIRWIMSLQNKI